MNYDESILSVLKSIDAKLQIVVDAIGNPAKPQANDLPPILPLMDVDQVMATTGVSRVTVWRWEEIGKMPKRIPNIGRMVKFRRSDIEDWIANGCKPVSRK
ncbi:MAG: helix-turn-helix domain-containing protein [Pirellulales bacterium]